jgi:hypothetical protein
MPESFEWPTPREPELKEKEKIFKRPERREEVLDYKPFDVPEELAEFRKIRHTLNREERRMKFFTIRETFIDQQLGMAKIIDDLRNAVERNPDASFDDLYGAVSARARDHLLTMEQRMAFSLAIQNYLRAHQAVEKYYKEYPDPRSLFAACFGRSPYGKIEAEKGSFTIFFRCFDKRDYILLVNYWNVRGDESKISKTAIAWTEKTGGIALNSTKIRELDGTVIAEFVPNNAPKYEFLPERPHLAKLEHGESFKLDIDNLRGEGVEIHFENGPVFKIVIAQRDGRDSFPLRLRSKDPKTGHELFDLMRVPARNQPEKGFLSNMLRRAGKTEARHKAVFYDRLKMLGQAMISYDQIEIRSVNRGGANLLWWQTEIVPVPNDRFSRSLRVHEEQHQFDKLFEPVEFDNSVKDIMMEVASRALSPAEIKQEFLRLVLKRERAKLGIDSKARDEILAYYREDTPLVNIYRILARRAERGGIYDPLQRHEGYMEDLPEFLLQEVLMPPVIHYWDKFIELIAKSSGLDPEDIKAEMIFKPEDVAALIPSVFEDGYRRDLRTWLRAVAVLERKEYDRDKIIAMLYLEPASDWAAFARRMPQASS